MPRINDGLTLATTLRYSDRDVFVEIHTASRVFYAKAFKLALIAELSKLPENEALGLRIVERDGYDCLYPTPAFLKAMREKGFPKAFSLKFANFADKLKTARSAVFVKLPTLAGSLQVKVRKSDLIEESRFSKPEQSSGFRVYAQTSGDMLLRAF